MTSDKKWCLFCPATYDTTMELINHMIDFVHKDENGNIIAFTGDKEEMRREFEKVVKD